MDVFCVSRRPEGKFKKKQSPRDEALQILKPQMDNPPTPQVHTHTYTHVKHMQNAIISHVNGSFCVCPAQTRRCRLSFCICNKRGGTQTCQNYSVKSNESSSAHTSSRYFIHNTYSFFYAYTEMAHCEDQKVYF